MDSEKQIDIKEKLDALNSLPGEAFNKDTAWDKLQQRLEKKPRRNKAVWYWAAACLLPLAVLLIWIPSNKKEIGLAQKKTQQSQHTSPPVTHSSLSQKDINTGHPIVSVEKNKVVKSIRTNPHSLPENKENHIKIDEPFIAGTNTITEAVPETATKVIPAADTNSTGAVATIALVKKKLRVVHVNELETAPAADPERLASSSNHGQNNFKLRFRNNHSSVNTPAADRQEYTSVLKIPLTN
jgi:hypothetical protein